MTTWSYIWNTDSERACQNSAYSCSLSLFIVRESGRISGHVKMVCMCPSACNCFVSQLVWKVSVVLCMGREGHCLWRTNAASLSNKLQESLVTLGWQRWIAGWCLLHLFLRVIQWACASGGGCHAFGRVHGAKEAVGHGQVKNTEGYLQNRKNNQKLFTD